MNILCGCITLEGHWSLVCAWFVILYHSKRISTRIDSFLSSTFSWMIQTLSGFGSCSLCTLLTLELVSVLSLLSKCFHSIHFIHWCFVMTKYFLKDWNESIFVNQQSLLKTFTGRIEINCFDSSVHRIYCTLCLVISIRFDDCCFLIVLLIVFTFAVINTIQKQIFNFWFFSIIKCLKCSKFLIEFLLHIKLSLKWEDI